MAVVVAGIRAGLKALCCSVMAQWEVSRAVRRAGGRVAGVVLVRRTMWRLRWGVVGGVVGVERMVR